MSRAPRIRLGMVGGGTGAFIGGVHRIASRLDDRYDLVAGAFSSTPETSRASAADLGIDPARAYDDFDAMADAEAAREDGIEAVSIVTPNHVHARAARAFLAKGIHVICDKPMTSTLEDAEALVQAAEASDALFVLTHNYSGHPMIRQARAMIAAGEIGPVRVVQVEYPQDWLATAVEEGENKQAAWRTDPERTGAGGCIGDIGTHAFHLAGFVSGLRATAVAADLQTFVPGRRVDDNAHVMMRYEGGARGLLWASQVAPGNENALRLRIYGETGGLEWAQEIPDRLWHTPLGEPKRLLTRAGAGFTETEGVRIPSGHVEGYLEAFANLYAQAADRIEAHRRGEAPDHLLPTVRDGLDGVRFIDACVRSSAADAAWTDL